MAVKHVVFNTVIYGQMFGVSLFLLSSVCLNKITETVYYNYIFRSRLIIEDEVRYDCVPLIRVCVSTNCGWPFSNI